MFPESLRHLTFGREFNQSLEEPRCLVLPRGREALTKVCFFFWRALLSSARERRNDRVSYGDVEPIELDLCFDKERRCFGGVNLGLGRSSC